MNTLSNITLVIALGTTLCTTTFAEGRRSGGPRGNRPDGAGPGAGRPEPAKIVEHLSTVYTTLVAYDLNKDSKIDETEVESVATAIADGTLKAPANHTPPEGITPDSHRIAGRLAGVYGRVAAFDTNNDGTLDDAELGAIKNAVENGELRGPGRPGGPGGKEGRGGPHGPKGGRGPRA